MLTGAEKLERQAINFPKLVLLSNMHMMRNSFKNK